LSPGSYAYFNHAYYCDPDRESDVLATTDYGIDYASVAGRDRLYGVQFHPEKSQAVGLQILRNFSRGEQ
jgi:glutamine amidotransferase